MIKNIRLKNFKCFEHLSLPLSSLTLMTGFNAAGKSTVLQSLLLMVQALRSNDHASLINLNGSLVQLGTPGEVIRENSDTGEVSIEVKTEGEDLCWTLGLDSKSSDLKYRNFLKLITAPDNQNSKIIKILKDTIFISAVRQIGLESFPSPEQSPVMANVGIHGEYAPWFFQGYDDYEIPVNKRHPDAKQEVTLRRQYIAWAGSIFPGTEANAKRIGEWSDLIELGLRVDQGEYRRPSNIGYGISYVFPILISGLLAQPGQILIIDSPEAHLHPRGQSHMGRFLAHMAQAGVQVIVETHSDHLLNGVRLAVKEQVISPDKVGLHFFRNSDPVDGKGPARVVSPVLDSHGALDSWPDGFFDQSDKDMASLMGWES